MLIVAAFSLTVATFAIGRLTAEGGEVELQPNDDAVVELGRQIYAEHCASCHGDRLQGQPNWKSPGAEGKLPAPPHDETGHTWHHADRLLFELTKFGLKKFAGDDYKTDMPVYDGVLSDSEIIAVLSFIKNAWPSAIQARHDQINAAARGASQ